MQELAEATIELLQRNVLTDQKVQRLTLDNWIKILTTILIDIYKYIDADSSEGQDILTGVITGALLGAAVGGVIGVGGVALTGGISSVLSKTVTDLISVTLYGGDFGNWEDYALAFAFGGLTGSLGSVTGKLAGVAKVGKFAADVALRPAANQLVKMGTRGSSFSKEKYFYDVATRAITYGGSNKIMKHKPTGIKIDLGKCFYRSSLRALYSYI